MLSEILCRFSSVYDDQPSKCLMEIGISIMMAPKNGGLRSGGLKLYCKIPGAFVCAKSNKNKRLTTENTEENRESWRSSLCFSESSVVLKIKTYDF